MGTAAVKEEEVKGERKCMGSNFQVADVKRSLIAVERITEKWNYVCFGPEPGGNYIYNKKSHLERNSLRKTQTMLLNF